MSNRRRLRPATTRPDSTATFWNGEPTPACRVLLRVEDNGQHTTPWYADLVGTTRRAVRVRYGGSVFYLDDEDGSGWAKVTAGHGSPHYGHRSLYGTEVVTL